METQTLVTDLAVRAKLILTLDEIFGAGGALVRIEADEDIAVTALRGTRPGSDPSFLFINQPHKLE